MATLEQTQGCLLGLSLGDALGAPYEGGFLEKLAWKLICSSNRRQLRWTDDTQMSIDVAESFLKLNRIDPDDLAISFAKSYRWTRGYGPAAARILRKIARGIDWRIAARSIYRDGSFGNGAAMRAPILGLIFSRQPSDLRDAVHLSASVTHAHPLALEGAHLIAAATASAIHGNLSVELLDDLSSLCSLEPFQSRIAIARTWLDSASEISNTNLIRQLGNGVAAHESCVTALYLAISYRDQPFLSLQNRIATLGGDTDTLGAMAGAIWGAAHGAASLPQHLLENLEQRDRLMNLASSLHQRISTSQPPSSGQG